MSLGQLTRCSRIAKYRDPSGRAYTQGSQFNFTERARRPDYAYSLQLQWEDRDQIPSHIAGGVLVQQSASHAFAYEEKILVPSLQRAFVLSDRAYPYPRRSAIGQIANEWVQEDRSDRSLLLEDVDTVETSGTRRSERVWLFDGCTKVSCLLPSSERVFRRNNYLIRQVELYQRAMPVERASDVATDVLAVTRCSPTPTKIQMEM
jgi:hypothetical protein